MLLLLLFFIASLSNASKNIYDEWYLHYGAHCHWRDVIYSKFNISSIDEVLNADNPSVNIIPFYFDSSVTMEWINLHFDELDYEIQREAKKLVMEAASIQAAPFLFSPKGTYHWKDVLTFHASDKTPYSNFLQLHSHLHHYL